MKISSLPVAGIPTVSFRSILFALTGTVLLTVSAKIQVPFYPVPMTLQTLVVLLIGVFLGPRLGLMTILLYIAEGATGLPVFAGTPEKGVGIAYLVGPTGGYLVGFALAAAFVGFLTRSDFSRKFFPMALILLLGNLLIYLPGLLWLGRFMGYDKVLELGLYPFFPGGALKFLLTLSILMLSSKLLTRLRPQRDSNPCYRLEKPMS